MNTLKVGYAGVNINPPLGCGVYGYFIPRFAKGFLDELEAGFPKFLAEEMPANPAKKEYLLPVSASRLLEAGKANIKVLSSADKWFGVTYAADKPLVVAALKKMTDEGLYPDGLWK